MFWDERGPPLELAERVSGRPEKGDSAPAGKADPDQPRSPGPHACTPPSGRSVNVAKPVGGEAQSPPGVAA